MRLLELGLTQPFDSQVELLVEMDAFVTHVVKFWYQIDVKTVFFADASVRSSIYVMLMKSVPPVSDEAFLFMLQY